MLRTAVQLLKQRHEPETTNATSNDYTEPRQTRSDPRATQRSMMRACRESAHSCTTAHPPARPPAHPRRGEAPSAARSHDIDRLVRVRAGSLRGGPRGLVCVVHHLLQRVLACAQCAHGVPRVLTACLVCPVCSCALTAHPTSRLSLLHESARALRHRPQRGLARACASACRRTARTRTTAPLGRVVARERSSPRTRDGSAREGMRRMK